MKYAAVIHHVGEVSLVGLADGEYWRQRLEREDLSPALVNGNAELMISATNARFLGVPFCELSISVFIASGNVESTANGAARSAAFLTHAYNSSRLLAFCERTMFRTPYFPARLAVRADHPISVLLGASDRPLLRAEMAPDQASASRPNRRQDDGEWQGPLFLPRVGARPAEVFYARLTGVTDLYPFRNDVDRFELGRLTDHAALAELIASRFEPREWTIRANATHARTKTFRRTAAGL